MPGKSDLTSWWRFGALASRPAAADVAVGAVYFATDTNVVSRSDGSTWTDQETFSGSVTDALGWFNVTTYGALGDGVTDDTSAIQDTIDACAAAGGGTVYFPAGEYIIGGALQDTGAFNGQLLLPDVAHSGVDHLIITFKGALRPGFHPLYGDTVPLADGLSVLKSTLTGASGTAAVISGGNNLAAPGSGGGNNLEVNVENLVCLGPDNPTFTFWNLSACQGGNINGLQISTPGAYVGSATLPTHTNSYGIKLPQALFANNILVDGLAAGGFYTGVMNGELAVYTGPLILGPLYYGIELPLMYYPSIAVQLTATSVVRVLRPTGAPSGHKASHGFDVLQYVRESSDGTSFDTEYDLYDPSDYGQGYIRWYTITAAGGGAVDTFLRSGGANVGDQQLGADWGTAGGGGSVATDTIWDTAGDLAVGTGSNTAAKLVKGNAGGYLSIINGAVAWNSGTSFPGSPATNDRYYRSDLNGTWYYNGSIWLSDTAHEMPFPFAVTVPLTGSGVLHRMIIPAALGGSDVYLAAVLTAYYVAGGTALSGSHKWVGTVSKNNNAGASSLGTITIDSGASSQWLPAATLSINAAAAIASNYVSLEINWIKTGTPGDLYAVCSLAYRTIAT